MASPGRLFVIVEGKNFDKPFYDAVLRSYPSGKFSTFDIREVELIDRNGSSAGGKKRALSIHKEYAGSRRLIRKDGGSISKVVFFLDRDYDDLSGEIVRSKHIVYTEHCDVEAEIFAHGDLRSSLTGSLSLSEDEADELHVLLRRPLQRVAKAWSTWLLLCMLAVALDSRGSTRPGSPSPINTGPRGTVDKTAEAAALSDIKTHARVSDPSARETLTRDLHCELQLHGRLGHFVRGKWVAQFLADEISLYRSLSRRDERRFTSSILSVLITHLPTDSWARHWHEALDAL